MKTFAEETADLHLDASRAARSVAPDRRIVIARDVPVVQRAAAIGALVETAALKTGAASANARGPVAEAMGDDADIVYSSDEADVEPPHLVRPQLPREPEPGADTGYFNLLVDELGNVEVVKLISPAHRYQDRMLVAAAKAWKFKPALLNGQPVKYRVRIPIILQDAR